LYSIVPDEGWFGFPRELLGLGERTREHYGVSGAGCIATLAFTGDDVRAGLYDRSSFCHEIRPLLSLFDVGGACPRVFLHGVHGMNSARNGETISLPVGFNLPVAVATVQKT
jgi:hypothetical protein